MKQSPYMRREARTGVMFSLPAILGTGVFFLAPFVVAIFYSLTGGGAGEFRGIANYADLMQNPAFLLASANTGKFIGIAVPLIMAISLCVALLLYKNLRGFATFRTLFIFPLVLPASSVALVFQILFAKNGAVNDLLTWCGLPVSDWLQSDNAFWVLTILYIWKNCGYNIILFLAALNAVPKDFYEAAEIDGAGGGRKFFGITVPLIMPYTFFILLISIINTFKSFREAYVLCGTHPHKSIYMMQHFLNNNFENINFVRLSSAAIIIFLVISALIFVLFWLKSRSGEVEL